MKDILILILFAVAFWQFWFYNYAPVNMWEDESVYKAAITWERDPAFVASMTKMADDSIFTEVRGMAITDRDGTTVIAPVPTNQSELRTFGHECLHAFGYTHN